MKRIRNRSETNTGNYNKMRKVHLHNGGESTLIGGDQLLKTLNQGSSHAFGIAGKELPPFIMDKYRFNEFMSNQFSKLGFNTTTTTMTAARQKTTTKLQGSV